MPDGCKLGVRDMEEELIEPVPLVNSFSRWSKTMSKTTSSRLTTIPEELIPEELIEPVPLVNSVSPRSPSTFNPYLTTIPEELIDRIISSLEKPALTHITHTCKLLSRIAHPHLWSTLHLILSFKTLPKPKRLALVNYLTENPLLASRVRELHIECKGHRIYPEFWIPWFATLANALPNLGSFVFADGFAKRQMRDYPLQLLLAPLQALARGKLQRLDLDYNDEPLASETSLFVLPISHLHIRRATLPKNPLFSLPLAPSAINTSLQSTITHLSLSDFPPGVEQLRPSVAYSGRYHVSWDHTYTCPHLLSIGRIFPHLISFSFVVAEKDSLPEFYARNMVQIVEKSLAQQTLTSLTIGGRASPAKHSPAKWGIDPAVQAMRVLRDDSKIEELDIYAGSLLEVEGHKKCRFDLSLPETLKRLTLRKVEVMYDKVIQELRVLNSQGVRKRFPSLERITICGSWGEVEVQSVRKKTWRLPIRIGGNDQLVVNRREGGSVAEMRKESEVEECFAGLREEYAEQGVRLDFVREECHKVGFALNELDGAITAVLEGRSDGSEIPGWQFGMR